MIRDTAERVMLAIGSVTLAAAALHFALHLLFAGRPADSSAWLGTVGGILLVAQLAYRWMRKRDVAEQGRRRRAATAESRYL